MSAARIIEHLYDRAAAAQPSHIIVGKMEFRPTHNGPVALHIGRRSCLMIAYQSWAGLLLPQRTAVGQRINL